MVNTEEFTERLQRVMGHYNLSAAAFSEQIGVQRSSISHLLSGRNKPSLDFVMRVIRTYPEVNLYWLLNGKGNFPANESEDIQASTVGSKPEAKKEKPSSQVEENLKDRTDNPKVISRIIIFYEDGSFESFSENLMRNP